jgi:hypothetical protein
VALAGFLARGGFVLLALPGVVLPSVIGLAGAAGVNAFTIAGRPAPWLIGAGVVGSLVFVAWFLLTGLVGAIVDVLLVEAALGDGRLALRRRHAMPDIILLFELVAIRGLCLIPLVATGIWAGHRIYDATYQELIYPRDLTVPLAFRVVEAAAGPILLVVVAWLITETIAAVAVRCRILNGEEVWRALGTALALIARRPIAILSGVAVSLGASVVAVGVPMLGTAVAFDWCREAVRNSQPIAVTIGLGSFSTTRDLRPLTLLAAALALAVVWLIGFAAAGAASAWRSAALTGEVAAALPACAPGELAGDRAD